MASVNTGLGHKTLNLVLLNPVANQHEFLSDTNGQYLCRYVQQTDMVYSVGPNGISTHGSAIILHYKILESNQWREFSWFVLITTASYLAKYNINCSLNYFLCYLHKCSYFVCFTQTFHLVNRLFNLSHLLLFGNPLYIHFCGFTGQTVNTLQRRITDLFKI